MIKLVQLARISDGKLLSEVSEEQDQSTFVWKQQVKQVVKSLKSAQDKISISSKDGYMHIVQYEGVAYIAYADATYPKQLSFRFLNDIKEGFQEELKKNFGTGNVDYRSKIETIDRPYYFLKFDRFIKKKKQEYQDVRSKENIARLKENLVDLQNIMQQSIDALLDREKNLTEIEQKASSLKDQSSLFAKNSRKLRLQALFYKYGIICGIIAIFLFMIFWRFYVFG